MRVVVQRVSQCEVWLDSQVYSEIDKGIVALLGIGEGDDNQAGDLILEKVLNLRIFSDDKGLMNLSLLDIQGDLMIISQFTLYGDCRKGRRPSFSKAMNPDIAEKLYERFVEKAKTYGINVKTGRFQAMMDVKLVNSGPVTLLIDSEKQF